MIFLALVLQAQTACKPIMGRIVCESERPLDYQALLNRGSAMVPQYRRPSVQDEVARRIQAGDCEGAKRVALKAGDVDLTAKAVSICGK